MKQDKIIQIMDWYYKEPFFNFYFEKVLFDKTLKDDFKHEVLIIIIDYDRDKIIQMWDRGELKWFVSQIIRRQIKSSTSTIHRKISNKYILDDEKNIFDMQPAFELYDEDKLDDILSHQIKNYLKEKKLKSSKDYNDVVLFEKYYFSTLTYREIEKEIGISLSTLYNSVERVRQELYKEFKDAHLINKKLKTKL